MLKGHTEAIVGQQRLRLRLEPLLAQREIDETGTTDLHRRAEVIHAQMFHDGHCNDAGRRAPWPTP